MHVPVITPYNTSMPPEGKQLVFLAGRCGSEDKRDEIIASVNSFLGGHPELALVDPRHQHYAPAFNAAWERRMIDHSKVFVCVLPIIMGRLSMMELGYWVGSRAGDCDARTIIVRNNADRDLVNAVGTYLTLMEGGVFLVDTSAEVPYAIGKALGFPMREPGEDRKDMIFLEEEVHDIVRDVKNGPEYIVPTGTRYILREDSKTVEDAKAGDIVEYDGVRWRLAFKPSREGVVYVKNKDKWYRYNGTAWVPYTLISADPFIQTLSLENSSNETR